MSWENLEGLSPQAYNLQFTQKLAADPGAVQVVGDNFVRDRLREDMVMNRIIPQTPVTPDKLHPFLDSDTLYEIIHLDTNAAASITDFRGVARGQVVQAPRVGLGFHMLRSDDYDIVEQELLVYPFPIVKLVHDYSIKAIGDQHDLYMLQNCQRAVDFVDANAAYKGAFGGGTVTGVDADGVAYAGTAQQDLNPVNSFSVVRAKKALSNRIQPSKMLMTMSDHGDLDALQLFEQGDTLRSETFVKGYRQPTWTGLEMVVTTKNDIFRPGAIWFFAPPDMLGKNRVLDYGGNAYKLFIDRRSNVITFHVYANFGAIIANVGSVAKLQLFTGNVTDPGYGRGTAGAAGGNYVGRAFASGVAGISGKALVPGDVDPLSITEDQLFRNRNLAESGGRFPAIRQW